MSTQRLFAFVLTVMVPSVSLLAQETPAAGAPVPAANDLVPLAAPAADAAAGTNVSAAVSIEPAPVAEASAAAVPANATPAATTNTAADFSWLTAQNLPSPDAMVDAAMAALPKTLAEKRDWMKRIKQAAWFPSLELRYGIGETAFRRFQLVDGRQVTTSSQNTRESSSQSGQNITFDPGSQSVTIEQTGNGGSRRSSSTGTSITEQGPNSFGLNDEAAWVNDYGVFLTWDLSRIIFSPDEISVVNAEISKETFRQNIRAQIVQTYFDLKESLLLLENDTYKDSVPFRIRKERLAYLLDTLTAGALSGGVKHAAAP